MDKNKLQKLNQIVNYCRINVPYYSQLLADFSFNTEYDFLRIPILTNEIYTANTPPYNNNLLSKSRSSSFVFSSGGTSTEPRYVMRDFEDFDDQYMDYAGLNVGEKDVVLNLFMPGIWGIFTSANISLMKLGCTIIPLGGSNLNQENNRKILEIIKTFNVNMLIGVPSTIVTLATFIQEKSNLANKIDKIFCLGEKIHQSTQMIIKSIFSNAVIKSKYGCMESAGIGYQCEYLDENRYHIFENQYVEILDAENYSKVQEGNEGIITVTTLKKRLVPLLRYKTNDIGIVTKDKCKCGQDKLLYVLRREQDMLISASVHFKIDIIERIISKFKECSSVFQLVVKKINNLDSIILYIEKSRENIDNPNCITHEIINQLFIQIEDLQEAIESKKLQSFSVELIEPQTIKRINSTGKIKKILDFRK